MFQVHLPDHQVLLSEHDTIQVHGSWPYVSSFVHGIFLTQMSQEQIESVSSREAKIFPGFHCLW